MPGELNNPERRYKGFHPRQAATSYFSPTVPTNASSHTLYNNSVGNQWLVLRNFQCNGAGPLLGFLRQGPIGAVLGRISPIIPTEAAPPGQHYYIDTTIGLSAVYLFPTQGTSTVWAHDYPIAIIPPGWGFLVQDGTVAEAMICSFFWESIYAEELDYIW